MQCLGRDGCCGRDEEGFGPDTSRGVPETTSPGQVQACPQGKLKGLDLLEIAVAWRSDAGSASVKVCLPSFFPAPSRSCWGQQTCHGSAALVSPLPGI